MKKKIAAALAMAMILACGCGASDKGYSTAVADGSDLEYIREKGTFVVGVTDFAPMDYIEDGAWTGFDARLAEDFARSIGVEAEFKEIDWDKKARLLEDGTVDCVWNGMTLTDELSGEIDCTVPYLSNSQVAVMRRDDVGSYASIGDCQHMLFAVEGGSAGEELLQGMNYRYSVYDSQIDALQSVSDADTDAAVVDIVMAGYYTRSGGGFDELGFSIVLDAEEICAGLRKDSDVTEKLDSFLEEKAADGTMDGLAAEYGIEGAVLH